MNTQDILTKYTCQTCSRTYLEANFVIECLRNDCSKLRPTFCSYECENQHMKDSHYSINLT